MSVYRLSELCEVCITEVRPARSFYGPGNFDVVGNGQQPRGTHDTANIPAKTIIISRKGCYGHVSRYDAPVYLTNEAYYLSHVSPIVDRDYLYFYLKYITPEAIKRVNYLNWKGLSMNRLLNATVYLPRRAEQQRIASLYLDFKADGSKDGVKRTTELLSDVAYIRKSVKQCRSKSRSVTEVTPNEVVHLSSIIFLFTLFVLFATVYVYVDVNDVRLMKMTAQTHLRNMITQAQKNIKITWLQSKVADALDVSQRFASRYTSLSRASSSVSL